jgi:U3 small nucleolar RNA-associated protein 4
MDAEFSISVRPNPSHLDSSERGGGGQVPSVPLHRCRFPDFTPSSITCLALTPTSFNSSNLNCGVDEKEGGGGERGILAVGRSNGQVELMIWGGVQGWVNWRTLPNSFPLPPTQGGGGKKPSPSLLSHLTWTHQTSLSPSDVSLYSDDLQEAQREIESLKRGKGLRLFGVGGIASELVEWEWKSGPGQSSVGMIKSTLPTLPPIFALTSSPTSSTLAISCEDSTIRLINILDGDLELISKIELGGGGIGGGKVRALSLTWGEPRPFEQEEEEEEENKLPLTYSTRSESYLLAGCSNSTIRRFDAPRNNNNKAGPYRGTLRMTLDRLKGEHTVVWALTTLRDGTIVSGDSMGNVKFWDGTMGTQLQSFKSHKSDVLCLGVGTDGQSIFTSGIDQKTVEFRKVSVNRTTTTSSTLSSTSRWIQSSGRRLHSHDVRAIVISPPYEPFSTYPCSSSSSIVPVMTSAGLDLSLILTPVASPPPTTSRKQREEFVNPVSNNPSIQFESTVHRRQSYVPMRSNLPFSVSTKPSENGRLLIARRDRSVGIWRLGQPNDPRAGGGGWEKLIDLEFKVSHSTILEYRVRD